MIISGLQDIMIFSFNISFTELQSWTVGFTFHTIEQKPNLNKKSHC